MFDLILKSNSFLFYLARNIWGIEWVGKIIDIFTSSPAAIGVLDVLILTQSSQWDNSARKKLKLAVERIWLDVIENIIYVQQS